jgi:hypothetical protein
MTTIRSALALLCAVALGACEKNAVQDITAPLPSARVRFFNFGVNAPQVNFYADSVKMTAISSATGSESTVGVAYGAVGAGGFYSAINPGARTLTGRISAIIDKDLPVATATTSLFDGRAYSFYMSGFYNTTTKTVDSFVIEDNFPESINYGAALVRFVHAISNAGPMTMLGKPSTAAAGTEAPITGLTSYKSGSGFVAVPPGVYDLSIIVAGATTPATTRTGVSFSAGRVYTITARGDITVTSTTATNRPFLDNTANR